MSTPPLAPLLHETAELAARYLAGLERRRVAPGDADLARLATWADAPLPGKGEEASHVVAELAAHAGPATVATAGPRFFGFVVGGALPASVAAHWLATAWDQNSFSKAMSPAGAALDRQALAWTRELLGLPAEAGGALVTGATLANFAGLAAARHALLARAGWDVEADGLMGAPLLDVVVSEEIHPTLVKGLGLLGLGRERVRRVPTDAQGRVRVDALPPLGPRSLVCVQAGNVNTGAIDPLEAVCDAASRAGAWVHVDGAIGLWAAACPSLRGRLAGVERADSWATDAHKGLNVPYDCGIAFVRDAAALASAMAIGAPYLTRGVAPEPGDHTPEASRRARGIDVWAALRSLGREGVADLFERCCRHARRFAAGLSEAGHAVLNEVATNQVLVDFGGAERTRRTIEALQRDGTCWCGGTEWKGRTAMRISVSSWATSDEDVEASLAAMLRAARAAA